MTFRHPFRLITTLLLLGALGDALLRVGPWSLNLVLWITALSLVVLTVAVAPERRRPVGRWLLLAILFAVLTMLRDAEFLMFWNTVAVLASLTAAALSASGLTLATARVPTFAAGGFQVARHVAIGAVPLVTRDLAWPDQPAPAEHRRRRAWAVGIVLAIPAVVVFGTLFSSADPVFARFTSWLFAWDFETLFSHAFLTGFFAWITAGYLHGLFRATTPEPVHDPLGGRAQWITVAIPLATVTALFAIFVAIQGTYLFGGEEWLRQSAGVGYAEYARSGFFELVAAVTLIVPLLLGGRWLLDTRDGALRRFHMLAVALLVLVVLVAASAIWRMRLYMAAYGLTEDRLYATAFMLWIGVVLAWFAVTTLREQGERFAFGAFVSGLALLAALTAINPDAIIARTNLARSRAGLELDVSYLSGLSSDAVPTVLAEWSNLTTAQQDTLEAKLLTRATRHVAPTDWRTWNVARRRARAVLGERQ
jgi:hypothetical protein